MHNTVDPREQELLQVLQRIDLNEIATRAHIAFAALQRRTLPKPPFNFLKFVVPYVESATMYDRIKIFEAENESHSPAHLISFLEVKERPKFLFRRANRVASIYYVSNANPEEVNFAVTKECCHLLLHEAIHTEDPSVLETLDFSDFDILQYASLLSSTDNLSEASERHSSAFILERTAIRLAFKILAPRFIAEEIQTELNKLDEHEELFLRTLARKLLIPSRIIEHFLLRVDQTYSEPRV